MNRFVFLDRDGTLVRDPGYVHRIEDYELLDGVEAGLRRLQEAGFGLAIVTNQSGIGRGYFSEEEFSEFQSHLLADLESKKLRIAASFHCPHAPDAGCACRKPAPGLFEQAEEQLQANLSASWMIGDSARDEEAAQAAGLAGAILIASEEAPGASAKDFEQAVQQLLERIE